MLKALTFLPCEKIIVSRENLFTIVNVLDSIRVLPTPDLSADGATQVSWEIMTLWHKDSPEDNDKKFEHRVELFRPDNSLVFTITAIFDVDEADATYRLAHKLGAFPVGIPGVVKLKLSIREAGDENEWQEAAYYPINVSYFNRGANVENENKSEAEQSVESV